MLDFDIYGELVKVVREQTTYLRHYSGQVIDNLDPLNKGRVKANIPELGFISKDLSVWCNARQGHGMSVPKINSWVEVYFLNGNPEFPVYLALDSKVAENIPSSYTGDVKQHVLFEDPNNSSGVILYDGNGKELTLLKSGEKITMLEGTESFVLGDTLKTELQKNIDALTQLQADFAAWVVAPNDGGAALKAVVSAGFGASSLASLTSILSDDIKGK